MVSKSQLSLSAQELIARCSDAEFEQMRSCLASEAIQAAMAEGLTGLYCTVPLAAARRLPADHYYHFQLVGLSVFDARRQRSLGRVEEVLSYAANDVLRVADGQREVLVPMLKSVVRGIEPQQLRDTQSLRQQVATQLSGVQSVLDGLMVDRPRRNILRPTD